MGKKVKIFMVDDNGNEQEITGGSEEEDSWSRFYQEVYGQDFDVKGIPHGWIQWKGTDICVDVHCKCGAVGHIDGEFFYYYRCAECGAKYAVGQHIKLIELNEQQVKEVENGSDFMEAEDFI